MIGQILAIARNTFLESVRQPIFFILLIAGWLLQVFNVLLSGYSMGYRDSSEVTGDNKLLLDIGLATVFIVATLLAAFLATAVLSREIENKTALTVISKPVGRPMFVIGKYLGVTGAILLASLVLLLFAQFALRHAVLSTARDRVDMPVMVFSLLAIGISIGVACWGNFFYGWVFSSSCTFMMAPTVLLAWLGILLLDKQWSLQPITTDLKPQVLITSVSILLAMPVLCGVAICASTRLGQVMTLLVCTGAFLLGLMSNHFLGSRAFTNTSIGIVANVSIDRDVNGDLNDATDMWTVDLTGPPTQSIKVGDAMYWGPSPVGVRLAVPRFEPFEGDTADLQQVVDPGVAPAIAVRSADADEFSYGIINVGGLAVQRPPEPGDYVFLAPTRVAPVAAGLWGVVPNLQFYWLIDAVTQNHKIPASYLGLVLLYTLAQVITLLALSVILFQKREVG